MCRKKTQSLRAIFDRACSMGETMVWVSQDKCLKCLERGEEGCAECTDGWGAMSYTFGEQETDVPCYWYTPTSELVKYFYDGYSDEWGAKMPLRFVEMLMKPQDNALCAIEQFDMHLMQFAFDFI